MATEASSSERAWLTLSQRLILSCKVMKSSLRHAEQGMCHVGEGH